LKVIYFGGVGCSFPAWFDFKAEIINFIFDHYINIIIYLLYIFVEFNVFLGFVNSRQRVFQKLLMNNFSDWLIWTKHFSICFTLSLRIYFDQKLNSFFFFQDEALFYFLAFLL
jgi:hypothetical protein